MQQGLNNRFAYLKDDKIFLLATILDPRFKMNFFFDHLQMEKARQYLLLEGLKTGFDGSSDESTHSSPIKKRRPEEILTLIQVSGNVTMKWQQNKKVLMILVLQV